MNVTFLGRRASLIKLALAAAALTGFGSAIAQNYPTKPIKVVVGSVPGALGDILARLVGQKLAEATGQSAMVDNRPGASGILAAQYVSQSAPDGHTVLVALDSVFVINPAVYAKQPYDTVRDFKPVALLGNASSILVARPALGVKTVADLVNLAKSKPDGVTFASAGVGHSTHVIQELIWNRLGVKLTHVPYKGSTLVMQDLLGDRVDLMLLSVPEAAPMLASGKLVALAGTGPAAKEMYPNLPELKASHPDLDATAWFGVFVPARTPPEVVAQLNGLINKAMEHPDSRKRLADFGLTPQPGPASALEAVIARDTARFVPLVKSLRISLD